MNQLDRIPMAVSIRLQQFISRGSDPFVIDNKFILINTAW